jgi:glycerol-3-phosphate dehydrogenase
MRLEYRLDKYDFNEAFDLIIIGGGINGAGIARDAAERGLKVLLLEKNDFAAGCSAHSTRLIHGGLRYLEYFEFPLVYESLHERETLLQNYPHLVSPLGLMIPHYKNSKHPIWKLKAGMMLYDLLSQNKSLQKHQVLAKDALEKLNLDISHKNLDGAVYYFDAQVSFAERLVLENILTAQSKGAICLNHCEVSEIIISKVHGKNIAQGVRFKDIINAKRPYTAYAKNVINLAGPWVDKVNERIKSTDGFQAKTQIKKLIGGTKGSHIVIKPFPGAPKEFGIYTEAKADGRPIFILPYKVGMNEDLLLIGTTDVFVEEKDNLDDLHPSQKEINYLLNEINELFPNAKINERNILNTFIGVRPLPYTEGSNKAGSVTRKHFIINHHKDGIENFYSVVGGKLTTFRQLSEEVVNLFTSNNCFSKEKKTVGTEYPENMNFYDYIKEITREYSRKYDIDAHTILHLLMLYGTNTNKVLDLTLENPQLKNKINKDFEDIEAQVIYAIRYEEAYTVEDIIKRRLSIGLCRNVYDKSIIKIINEYLLEEFELFGRQRDKAFIEVLTGDYNN